MKRRNCFRLPATNDLVQFTTNSLLLVVQVLITNLKIRARRNRVILYWNASSENKYVDCTGRKGEHIKRIKVPLLIRDETNRKFGK